MIQLIDKPLEGLILFKNTIHRDGRGFFLETYTERETKALGIEDRFVQENHSCSSHGVLRGLHFQNIYAQAQIVRVIKGEIYDVAVNINPRSSDFGKYFGVFLKAENYEQFYMSADYAHGFLVLSEEAQILYKCSQYYHPEDEDGIIYNDKTVNINWPLARIKGDVIISEKDLTYASFADYTRRVSIVKEIK